MKYEVKIERGIDPWWDWPWHAWVTPEDDPYLRHLEIAFTRRGAERAARRWIRRTERRKRRANSYPTERFTVDG